jgi:hypothetical protein
MPHGRILANNMGWGGGSKIELGDYELYEAVDLELGGRLVWTIP